VVLLVEYVLGGSQLPGLLLSNGLVRKTSSTRFGVLSRDASVEAIVRTPRTLRGLFEWPIGASRIAQWSDLLGESRCRDEHRGREKRLGRGKQGYRVGSGSFDTLNCVC